MLDIQNLTAGYPGHPVLEGLNLSIPEGKVTVIAGPNGCGKSTLLKALVGILPSEGKVLRNGTALTELPQKELAQTIAYLPQSRQVPELSVWRLVLHGRFPYLRYPRRYRAKDHRIAADSLERLGIGDLKDRMLPSLSGGQRQKAYIAMILAQQTPVVLLDEPTTYLDLAHQMQTLDLARFLADTGKTVVLVLHDLAMALEFADHLVILSDGRIMAQGDAQTVFQSGCLSQVFGVEVRRMETTHGWKYYYERRHLST